MTLFDALNYCTKKTPLPLSGIDVQQQIETTADPYILQRYMSMATPEHAMLVNETTNRWLTQQKTDNESVFTNELFLKFLHHVTPRYTKFIKYMKRTITIFLFCVLFVSCAKNKQEILSPPPAQKIKYINPISEDWYYVRKETGETIFY